MNHSKLAAIRTGRRSLAVAVFEGTHLDYTQTRHLASDHQKAEESAVGFVRWVLEKLEVETAVLEHVPEEDDSRRAVLSGLVLQTLRSAGVSVWEVGKGELFGAYAIPPLKTRKELRAICASFWPILIERRDAALCLDAAALGLHVATERLFLT